MAFQPPQRPQQAQQHRLSRLSTLADDALASRRQAEESPLPIDSQEWILFSPDDDRVDEAYTSTASTTDRTARTGRAATQLSDFGSLDTTALSQRARERRIDNTLEIEEALEDDEDNEDLDSLDDGLHAFNEPHLPSTQFNQHRGIEASHDTVLPTHDGLGKFPGNSSPVQEQFWQHERFNPHRRRRSSLRRVSIHRRAGPGALEELTAAAIATAATEEAEQKTAQEEKFEWIERWRAEQSKAILEEIERETRRIRRQHKHAASSNSQASLSSQHAASQLSASSEPLQIVGNLAGTATSPDHSPASSPESESFWKRFTRKVIRDLMGLDDRTLSLIFGESLITDDLDSATASEMIHESQAGTDMSLSRTVSWEDRLLARIAKELGTLINHISEHPGAFSTFLRTQEPIPYAGLPNAIPSRTATALPTTASAEAKPASPADQQPQPPSSAYFAPTLAANRQSVHFYHRRRQSSSTAADASLWGIEEEPESYQSGQYNSRTGLTGGATSPKPIEQEREYWEKDLDVKMVFKFLRGRISSSFSSSSSVQTSQYPTMLQQQSPAFQQSPLTPLHQHNSYLPSSSTATAAAQLQFHQQSPLTPHLNYTSSSTYNTHANSAHNAKSVIQTRHINPTPTADTLRRAALIRQHHPLVSTSAQKASSHALGSSSTNLQLSSPNHIVTQHASIGSKPAVSSTPLLSPVLGRRPSEGSCASQSTKRSRTARSGSRSISMSSRNYWDIGGSSSGGHGIGAGGGDMGGSLGSAWGGAWGEV